MNTHSKRPTGPGEELVAAYLRQRRWKWKYEIPISGSTRTLDFFVDHSRSPFFIEVYEPQIRLADHVGGFVDPYGPLRGVFNSRKRSQVKAAKQAGLPYVGAVADAASAIEISPMFMMGLMFGQVAYSFPVDDESGTGDVEAGKMIFGSGARLQPKLNRGVSAIVLPRRIHRIPLRLVTRMDPDLNLSQLENLGGVGTSWSELEQLESDPASNPILIRMIVLHNPFAYHPLPLQAFTGRYDEQWNGIQRELAFTYERVWVGSEIRRHGQDTF